MNNQEAFDIMVRHAFKQRCKSMDEKGICLYRGPETRRCFVGALISDEDYYPCMDEMDAETGVGSSVESLEDRGLLPANLEDVDMKLLNRAQGIHDDYEPSEWFDALNDLADMFDLSTKVLEQQTPIKEDE